MTIRLSCTFLLGFALLICSQSVSQKLMYDHFNTKDGITNSFINTINKGKNGHLFIGTGEGLFRYDGFTFSSFSKAEGLAEDVIESSYKDTRENLWFGHKSGGVTRYDGSSFYIFPLEPYTHSKIASITEDQDGNIWIATQTDGILRINEEDKIWQFQDGFDDFALYSIKIFDDGKCVAGTDMGAIWFQLPTTRDQVVEVHMLDEIPLTNIYCLEVVPEGDEILVGAEDEGLFRIRSSGDDLTVSEFLPKLNLEQFQFYDFAFDHNGDLWLGTKGKSLWQLQFEGGSRSNGHLLDYNVNNTLGAKNIKSIFPDKEGNIWIGSFGEGLYKLKQSHITFYSFDEQGLESGIFSIMRNGGDFWFGGYGSLYKTATNPGFIESEFHTEHGLPNDRFTGMVIDQNNDLWLATRSSGLYKKPHTDSIFTEVSLSRDELSRAIYDLSIGDEKLYVATGGGLYILEDGEPNQHLTVRDGLPHNTVKSVIYYDGKAWVAAKGSMLSVIENGELSSISIPSSDRLIDVSDMTVTSKGDLLIATTGNGIFQLSDDEWYQVSKVDGLYSNYCYSVEEDSKGRIWVGHNGGLSRTVQDNEWEIFRGTEGLDCTFHPGAAYSDQNNNMLFGTGLGLMFYNESKDRKNEVEPNLNISAVEISDSLYDFEEGINLGYGAYRLKVNFQGLSFRNPEDVKYSYILEGHDLSWSPQSTARSAVYNRLDPGNYTFKVKTYNSDGYGGDTVKSFSLFVDKPFWEKWWFFVGIIILSVIIIRYVVVRRLRFLKRNQEYLQKELKQRSKEVLDQKELLEQKNKDITDSIIYAKHIQTAMLPSDNDLYACFPTSFVFFRPRDIVSGDFYWVKQFEEKIVIACADCTGHGVPGAFMSLISTSLLKEVSNGKEINSPKKALYGLQKEMRKTLGYDQQHSVRDGMDISIVEIDRETLTLRASSARRPIVIYKGSERKILPGDRISIGDQLSDEDFEFTEYEVEMKAGDSFYMFSDGFQDQFGGERGKKLKKKGLLDILDEAHTKNMLEQSEFINRQFVNWKEGYEQVDDVILIGVRL